MALPHSGSLANTGDVVHGGAITTLIDVAAYRRLMGGAVRPPASARRPLTGYRVRWESRRAVVIVADDRSSSIGVVSCTPSASPAHGWKQRSAASADEPRATVTRPGSTLSTASRRR